MSQTLPTRSPTRLAPLQVGLGLLLAAAVVWSVVATRPGLDWRAGARALAGGHYLAAVQALEAATNEAPPGVTPGYDAARAHLALSWAYLARRDYARATAVLPEAGGDPALAPAVLLQRGRIAAAQGDRAAATAWFGRAAQAAPDATIARAARWHAAELAWAAGDPGAPAAFAALITLPAPPHDPYAAAAWLRLAELRAPTDPAAARQALASARAALPVDPARAAGPDLGLAALDLGEGLPTATLTGSLDRLDADLRGVAGLQGTGLAVQDVYWGRALDALEAWPQAAAALQAAVQADPTLADAYAYLGLAEERQGHDGPAEAAYRTALRLAPTHDLARQLLARFLLAHGRLAEAGTLIDAVLAANPDSVVAHLDRAGWAAAQGRYDLQATELQAAEQAQQAHLAAGTATPAERDLDTALLLAQFYFTAGAVYHDCSLARDAAGRAVARQPGAPEFDALGWAEHLCGDDGPARTALERAAGLDPRDPSTEYHLGVVLKALGDPGARAALDAARDLDPGGVWERRALAAITAP